MKFKLYYFILIILVISVSSYIQTIKKCNINEYSLLNSKSIDTLIDKPIDRQVKFNNFQSKWVNKKILTNQLRFHLFDRVNYTIFGLQTTRYINKNEKVITLPLSQCLEAPDGKTITGCPKDLDKDVWLACSSRTRLALLLLEEYNLGSESFLFDYIEALPNDSSITPINWPENIINSLPYEYFLLEVKRQSKTWKNIYDRLPHVWKSKYSYQRFLWAMETIRSRSFIGEGASALGKYLFGATGCMATALFLSQLPTVNEIIPAAIATVGMFVLLPAVFKSRESSCKLLPVIDNCNHNSSHPTCKVNFDSIFGNFELIAQRDVTPGDEITISYSNKSNDEFLQYFSFIEEDNINDDYRLFDLPTKLTNLSNNITNSISSNLFDQNSTIILAYNRNDWKIDALDNLKESDRNDLLKSIINQEVDRLNNYIDNINYDSYNDIYRLIYLYLFEKVKLLTHCIRSIDNS